MDKYCISIWRQAGSTSGLIPVLEEMLENGRTTKIIAIALDSSISEISESVRKNKKFKILYPKNESEANKIFSNEISVDKCQLLVTGTSEKSIEDAVYWKFAREKKIKSITYIDQWSNLEKRFSGISYSDWPDTIIVIDEAIKRLIKKITPEYVKIEVQESYAIKKIKAEVELLRKLGVKKTKNKLLFVTEPQVDNVEFQKINGFNDIDSFNLLIKIIDRFLPNTLLSIRLHPRDKKERWFAKLPKSLKWEWDVLSRSESIATAQIIFGMRSFFLLEAFQTGANVISLQPGKRTSCFLETKGIPVVITEGDYQNGKFCNS
jgi:hypothetical protein